MNINKFEERLKERKIAFHPVVPFSETDKLLLLDFTANNIFLTPEILSSTLLFTEYVEQQLRGAGATYGIGGYDEHRTIYSRSAVFDTAPPGLPEGEETRAQTSPVDAFLNNQNSLDNVAESSSLSSPFGGQGAEPRRLHLGVDIWGPVDTPIYAPLEGIVHSVGFNDAYGDYGATLILQHEIDGLLFHTLYGHLSLKSIQDKQEGMEIEKGAWIASFGDMAQNGNWPPHLHFQLILDMQGMKGDYPGVCKYSEREQYLANCPNPDLLLNMLKYAQ